MSGVLLKDLSFRPAGEIDGDVPNASGVYAIRLAGGVKLPGPFETLLSARPTRLIYIGKATSLCQEVHARKRASRTRPWHVLSEHRRIT